jgi:hypothetical protein
MRRQREEADKALEKRIRSSGGWSAPRTAEDRVADALEKIARNQRDAAQGYSQSWADCGNGTYGRKR